MFSFSLYFITEREGVPSYRFPAHSQAWEFGATHYDCGEWYVLPNEEPATHTFVDGKLLPTYMVQ